MVSKTLGKFEIDTHWQEEIIPWDNLQIMQEDGRACYQDFDVALLQLILSKPAINAKELIKSHHSRPLESLDYAVQLKIFERDDRLRLESAYRRRIKNNENENATSSDCEQLFCDLANIKPSLLEISYRQIHLLLLFLYSAKFGVIVGFDYEDMTKLAHGLLNNPNCKDYSIYFFSLAHIWKNDEIVYARDGTGKLKCKVDALRSAKHNHQINLGPLVPYINLCFPELTKDGSHFRPSI